MNNEFRSPLHSCMHTLCNARVGTKVLANSIRKEGCKRYARPSRFSKPSSCIWGSDPADWRASRESLKEGMSASSNSSAWSDFDENGDAYVDA